MSATKTLPLSLLIPSGLSLSLLISLTAPLQAQPVPATDGTGTLVTPDGQRYDIHGGTLSRDGQNLFHSFQQFGLNQTETANFISNPDIRNILGRVVGGDPSIINGLIQITGGNSNLFLINPAGILFGANASLNLPADFTATTATGIGFGNNQWFNIFANNDYANLTGTPSAFIFPSTQLGTIINEGNLNLTNGSNLNLFANTVINTGTITVPGGNVNITAIPSSSPLSPGGRGARGEGRDYILRLSQPGHILSLEIDTQKPGFSENRGFLAEILTGGDPIHHATTVTKQADGTIRLTGSQTSIPLEPGITVVSGNMSVATGQMTNNQGQMTILGDKIALIGANIDASGTNGAGNIHIGLETGFLADSSSPSPSPVVSPSFFAATHTYIDPNTTITANAINSGNGGQIIIWSDNTTQFHGNISATGIENGGFVEVSGKQNLIFRGNVDLSSVNGQSGTLLLDPENIIIVSGSGAPDDSQLSDNQILFGDDPDATYTISERALENLSGDANVILEATNNITIENLSDDRLSFQPGSGTIELIADADEDGNGAFTMNPENIIGARGRDITISAASVTTGTINTNNSTSGGDAGNITITTSGGNISTGPLNSFAQGSGVAGNVTLSVTGGNGSIDTASGAINAGSANGTGGNITLSTAGGNITTANLTSRASGSGTGGNITLNVNGGTGAINTTAGLLNALSQRGQGGNITLSTAGGDITTGEVTAGDIQAGISGNITINVQGTTGNINTTAQPLRASSGVGDAGNVTLTTGGGNITTQTINARPSSRDNSGEIKLEVLAGSGVIDTTAGTVNVSAIGGGNGGNIVLRTVTGDITTGSLSASANGGGMAGSVTLQVQGGTGSIDTSGIDSNVAIDSNANGGGDGGNISLSVVGGDITAGKLNSRANGQGRSGDIEIIAPAGTVDFTNQVDSGNLDITGTEIDFTGGNSSVNGSGELLLQPGNASQNINLGATEGTAGLDISATDLAALQNRFTAIRIGVEEGSGNITLGNDASFKSPVTITGGSTLTGPNRNTTWTLTGANTGSLSGYNNGLTFTNIENLTGGTASDKFVFNPGASLSGIIDGGPGIDSLDYSNFDAPFTVKLAENIATATDGVFNIEELITDNTPTPPDGETPDGETPDGETPDGETPDGETPDGETPDGETPDGETPLFSPDTPSLPAVTELEISPPAEELEVPPTNSPPVQTAPVAPPPAAPTLPSITLSNSDEAPAPVTTPAVEAATPVIQVQEPTVAPVIQVPEPTAAPVTPVPEPTVAPVTPVPEPTVAPVIQVPEPTVAPVIQVPEPTVAPVIQVPEPTVAPVIQVSETAPVIQVSEPVFNPDGLKPNEPLTPNSELGMNVAIPLWAQPPQFTAPEERFLGSGANQDVAPTPPAEENSILRLTSREDIGLLLAAGNVSEAAVAMDLLFSEEFENYLGYKAPKAYLSFGQLQNKLRQGVDQQQKPAIIYIFARTNRLDLILVPPEGKPIYKSVEDVPRETVLAKVAEFKGEIANPTRRRTTSYLPAAQQLYQWTIAPLEPDLKRLGIETLLVSPDAGLRTLPLAALHDGERFLVEKYSLSLIPSFYLTDIGVTADMRQAQVLAMGMSEFQDQSPLPAVPVEVKTIGENLWSGEVFLNQDFTLANLQKLQASNRNGILHLATHGQFQSGQPANSYIQMWDQKLSLDEMRNLNWRDLNVELLVLSACRTAVGDEGVEFGFAGLAVASGVKTAVASLWYANDAATLGLMSEFYYQLRSAPTKAEALRRAQISMLQGNVRVKASETERELVGEFGSVPLPSPLADGTVLQHPYFWSGFTAIGSPW